MTEDAAPCPWLLPRPTRSSGRPRLLCLPFAGGGVSVFGSWQDALQGVVDVEPVVLPGRDRRIREAPAADRTELLDAMAEELAPELTGRWAVFGHSLGALLGWELVHRVVAAGARPPEHLFVAGFRAPDLPDRNPRLHELDDRELVDALERLGGSPPEVLAHESLMAFLLPTLRADLRLAETYRHTPRAPLAVPVTAFAGTRDPLVEPREMEPWERHTTAAFRLVELEGEHFFLESRREELLARVREALEGKGPDGTR